MIENIKKYLYTNYPSKYGVMKYIYALITKRARMILLKFGFRVYFSGKNQDEWVIKTLNEMEGGYFIDLAATDGIVENNTYVLEKKFGWKGIAIEPNKKFFKKLSQNRDCHCTNFPVSTNDENVEFLDNGGIGGIISDFTDNNMIKRARLIEKLRKKGAVRILNSKSLVEVLDFYRAPARINYLSLDVEGSEWQVLKDFPFDEYIFELMTIERPNENLCKHLFANDYVFVKNHKVDTFFAHKSCVSKYNIKTSEYNQLPAKKW